MLVSLLVLPTVVRRSVAAPTNFVPRRSSSKQLAYLLWVFIYMYTRCFIMYVMFSFEH
ncbi:hypothetical protein BD408DRAFT_379192 [Parasitella parasitica]|nr:hypothetical protein BD408DRAFT_379192 [Parasitella parasitica]